MAPIDLRVGEKLRLPQEHSLGIEGAQKLPEDSGNGKVSFGDFLMRSIDRVNELGVDADRQMQMAITGKQPNPHAALLAVQEAEISFTLMMSIKERLEAAYQQLSRMQI